MEQNTRAEVLEQFIASRLPYSEVERRVREGFNVSKNTIEISADGYWVINGEKTEHKATGTDGKGIQSATIKNGELILTYTDGKTDNLGKIEGGKGDNGTSVTVKSVSESSADGGSNVVTFSDGKTVTIKNGNKGDDGDNGVGISSIERTATNGREDTYTITLTNGVTRTFIVTNGTPGKNGSDGKTPVKGVDYFTDGDIADMVTAVMNAIGTPLFGVIDENNHITFSGKNIPDGTYTWDYKMEDGSRVPGGTFVLDTNVYYTVTKTLTYCTISNSATKVVKGEPYTATITANSGYELKSVTVMMGGSPVSVSGGAITIASVTGNIVISAVAEADIVNALHNAINSDGSPFVGTNGEKGYKTGVRISGSSGNESTQSGCMATGFIEVTEEQKAVVENITPHTNDNYNVLVFYDASFTKKGNTTLGGTSVENPSTGTYIITPKTMANASTIRYIRFSCATITENSSVTVTGL